MDCCKFRCAHSGTFLRDVLVTRGSWSLHHIPARVCRSSSLAHSSLLLNLRHPPSSASTLRPTAAELA